MGKTSIEWTATYHADGTVTPGHSTNPIRARHKTTNRVGHYCEKISPGCTNCYASDLQWRFGTPPYLGKHRDEMEPFLDETKLHEVRRRKKPTTYFWEDMSDLFGDWVRDAWIYDCLATMALTPWHTHQLLTKRCERMATFFKNPECADVVYQTAWEAQPGALPPRNEWQWPLQNVWCGGSVEDQKTADERILWLLKTPAAVLFVSYEPALGPVDFSPWFRPVPNCAASNKTEGTCDDERNLTPECHAEVACPRTDRYGGLNLVIVGQESGPKARSMDEDWIRSARDQCAAFGVAFFYKQKLDERRRKVSLPLLDGRQHTELPGGQT